MGQWPFWLKKLQIAASCTLIKWNCSVLATIAFCKSCVIGPVNHTTKILLVCWAQMVTTFCLLSLSLSEETSKFLPVSSCAKNYVVFCLKKLSCMNNTKTISNSPKDSVVCKPAFQPIPSLTRACTMDDAGAGEGVWRLDDALVRKGKLLHLVLSLCSQGRQILALSFLLFLWF